MNKDRDYVLGALSLLGIGFVELSFFFFIRGAFDLGIWPGATMLFVVGIAHIGVAGVWNEEIKWPK